MGYKQRRRHEPTLAFVQRVRAAQKEGRKQQEQAAERVARTAEQWARFREDRRALFARQEERRRAIASGELIVYDEITAGESIQTLREKLERLKGPASAELVERDEIIDDEEYDRYMADGVRGYIDVHANVKVRFIARRDVPPVPPPAGAVMAMSAALALAAGTPAGGGR